MRASLCRDKKADILVAFAHTINGVCDCWLTTGNKSCRAVITCVIVERLLWPTSCLITCEAKLVTG